MTHEDDVDARIHAALKTKAAPELDLDFDEQSLFVQAMQIFRGRNRWINSIMVLCSLACLSLSGYAAFRYYWAVDVKELIAWSVAFMIGLVFVSIMKIWAWLEMEKYSTIREIKRLELQVVTLRERIRPEASLEHLKR